MEPLRLEVWSDVACPWCWIGHARLRRALMAEDPDSVQIVLRAFELRPDLPPEGEAAEDAYPRAFGSAEAARDAFARTTAAGAEDGLALRFDLVRRVPNTRKAHQLLKVAEHYGRGPETLEALFSAYLREGLDVGDPEVAVGIVAATAGLEGSALLAALEEGIGLPEVAADRTRAAQIGIRGVPFFLAGARVALSGAHEPAERNRLFAVARERVAAAAYEAAPTRSSRPAASRSAR